MQKLDFQPHIAGLRAIAVGAVVAYHFGGWLPGGFVGVDVFFVISGFLMTAILYSEAKLDRRLLSDFYLARFRRIYPAMAVMVAVVLAVGFFRLAPDQYEALGTRAAYSLASLGNVRFWTESTDYFALGTSVNPLLHLWSLGVEFQFYLAVPLVLMLVRQLRPISQALTLGGIGALSLAACIIISAGPYSTAAFFLSPFRVWEFLAGSAAYAIWLRRPWVRAAPLLSSTGLLAIAAAAILYAGQAGYPGALAVIPVFGAVLALAFPFPNSLLDNPISQWIGKTSYSIYLWHWPIWIVAQRLEPQPSVFLQAACVPLTLVAAWVSYTLVERSVGRKRRSALRAGFGTACAVLFSLVVTATHGLSTRVPEVLREPGDQYLRTVSAFSQSRHCFLDPGVEPSNFSARCTTNTSPNAVLYWGDSYGAALSYGAEALANDPGKVMRLSAASCPPLLDPPSVFNSACPAVNNWIDRFIIESRPSSVILFARWQSYDANIPDFMDRLRATLTHLRSAGISAVLVGPTPEWEPTLPQVLFEEYFAGRGVPPVLLNVKWRELEALDNKMAGLAAETSTVFHSLLELLCSEAGTCTTIIRGEPREDLVTYDYGHLTVAAARSLIERWR